MTSHIKHIHDDAAAFCGATLTDDFHFKSVDAAVLNGMHEKKPIVCRACMREVIMFLFEGAEICPEIK